MNSNKVTLIGRSFHEIGQKCQNLSRQKCVKFSEEILANQTNPGRDKFLQVEMALPFPAVKITHGGRCREEVSLTMDQPSAKRVIGLSQCNAIQKSFENLLDFQCKDFVATCMTATRYFCRSWNQQQKALNVLRHPDCLFPFQDTFLIT